MPKGSGAAHPDSGLGPAGSFTIGPCWVELLDLKPTVGLPGRAGAPHPGLVIVLLVRVLRDEQGGRQAGDYS